MSNQYICPRCKQLVHVGEICTCLNKKLYAPEEIKAIMDANYEKSMDLPSFYSNMLKSMCLVESKEEEYDRVINKWQKETFEKWMKMDRGCEHAIWSCSPTKVKRPPLGIMPEWLWREKRKDELDAAIKRYQDELKEVPQGWIDERYEHGKWLQERTYSPVTEPKKEWEILTWHTPNGWGICKELSGTHEDNLKMGFKIRSIKRLSDGEIFCVGDEIDISEYGLSEKLRIDGFVFEYGVMYAKYAKLNGKNYGKWVMSSSTKKVPAKQPLFTSEDGVPIYEDSELWWLRLNDGVIRQWNKGMFKLSKYVTPTPIGFKYFSTEAAAKDYWEKHRPKKVFVREFWYECRSTMGGAEYCFEVSSDIPEDKKPAIKQAIEDILNK